MKKLLTFMLCICAASISYAQLKVFSNGYTTVGRTVTTNPTSPFTIGNGSNNLTSYNTMVSSFASVTTSFNTAIEGYAGASSAVSGKRAFGIKGIALNSTNGFNYGILGGLNTYQYGAGVFGTIHRTTGVYVDGMYAGYFDGNTKVDGVLTVTDGINGIILGNEAMSTSRQSLPLRESGSNNVSESLTGINAIAYFKEQPVSTATERGDTSSTERPVSTLTTQNLSKKHYGLSAAQLEQVYPDLVYENEDGTKSINYVEMIPLLVQAIGELNAELASLENSNAKTKNYNGTSGVDEWDGIYAVSLSQNKPNPFINTTNIEMNIPSDAFNAYLSIYDMNGKQAKQIAIHERGKIILNVTSENLSAGMYLYSLIIDGTVIDTKRMILTK